MSSTNLLDVFATAQASRNGYLLSSTLDPSNETQLFEFVLSSTAGNITTDLRYGTVYNAALSLTKAEAHAWIDIYHALWRAGRTIIDAQRLASIPDESKDANWIAVYERWKEVANAVIAGYQKGVLHAWTIPCLYAVGRWTRAFAMRADEQANRQGKGGAADVGMSGSLNDDAVEENAGMEKLEDAGRLISRIFSLCISDRAPIEDSRKWGCYYISNLLFKTYFKLNQVNLCKNILRSIQASSADMSPLSAYPKPHIITFMYYVGVISFLEEDYIKAEEYLTAGLALLPPQGTPQANKPAILHNRQLLLTYLIPTRLLTSHVLPTPALLAPYARLRSLFSPLASCIKRGDLHGFDMALEQGSSEFVKRRIYLTLERGRDICLRNLFRKVFLAGGFDEGTENVRRTRIPVAEFVAAVRVSLSGRMVKDGNAEGDGEAKAEGEGKGESSGQTNIEKPGIAEGVGGSGIAAEMVDRDEVECLIANMVYKSLMKGYISREKEKVVLSKAGAFPGTRV